MSKVPPGSASRVMLELPVRWIRPPKLTSGDLHTAVSCELESFEPPTFSSLLTAPPPQPLARPSALVILSSNGAEAHQVLSLSVQFNCCDRGWASGFSFPDT